MESTIISIQTIINQNISKVWECSTKPEHITHWNFASDDWYCPKAEIDLRIGGKFSFIMSANDASFSFDFWGIYEEIIDNKRLVYKLGDGRKVWIDFSELDNNKTLIIKKFETETENSVELQQEGWQNILDNLKKHAETI